MVKPTTKIADITDPDVQKRIMRNLRAAKKFIAKEMHRNRHKDPQEAFSNLLNLVGATCTLLLEAAVEVDAGQDTETSDLVLEVLRGHLKHAEDAIPANLGSRFMQ